MVFEEYSARPVCPGVQGMRFDQALQLLVEGGLGDAAWLIHDYQIDRSPRSRQ